MKITLFVVVVIALIDRFRLKVREREKIGKEENFQMDGHCTTSTHELALELLWINSIRCADSSTRTGNVNVTSTLDELHHLQCV